MKTRPPQFEELAKLLMVLVDGQATQEQLDRLTAMISSDAEARSFYIRYLQVNARLQKQYGSDAKQPAREDVQFECTSILFEALEQDRQARESREAEEAAARGQKQAELAERRQLQRMLAGHTDKSEVARNYVIPRPIFYGGIAAAMALVAMVLWQMAPKTVPQPGPAPAPQVAIEKPVAPPLPVPPPQRVAVATLVAQVDAQWEGAAHGLQPGEAVYNERLQLAAGFAKLQFDNGAEVILEAPAMIEPLSATELRITRGKLVGTCPTLQSRGFTVFTPGAKIVDVATEFAVGVDEAGETLAQVYRGEIILAGVHDRRQATPAQSLVTGQATRVDSTGAPLKELATQPLAFVRDDEFTANLRAGDSAYYRWLAYSYQLRRDPTLLLYYAFDAEDRAADQLRNQAMRTVGQLEGVLGDGSNPRSQPTWGRGRFADKPALLFNRRQNQRVFVHDWPQVASGEALTVACWVRLHSDGGGWHLLATQWNDAGLGYDKFAFHLGVRCPGYAPGRADEYRKPGVQIHVSADGETTLHDIKTQERTAGSTAVADGWVHVAFTLQATGGPVRLYKDGVEIDANGATYYPPHLPTLTQPLVLGGKVTAEPHAGLDGLMDELVVLDRAMTSDEIAAMYAAGQPAAGD